MRKNNMPKVMAFLLALALVSTSMLSGTFAKYSSEFAGQDTALVARWNFVAAAGQVADFDREDNSVILSSDSEAKRVNLFGHEYNKHIVTSEGGFFIIAPGVESMFALVFANDSDVSAKLEIEFELVSGSALIPMEFNVPDDFEIGSEVTLTPSATWVTLGALSAEVLDRIGSRRTGDGAGSAEVTSEGDIVVLPTEDDEDIVMMPISWRWPFERPNAGDDDGDAEDTGLGMESASGDDRTEYELLITVKATQVAPEK